MLLKLGGVHYWKKKKVVVIWNRGSLWGVLVVFHAYFPIGLIATFGE